jgi:hypothetical protein
MRVADAGAHWKAAAEARYSVIGPAGTATSPVWIDDV